VRQIVRAAGLPLLVDGDTGFGGVLNVMDTVRSLEEAGAGAVHIEDQMLPKKCGHLNGKHLVEASEMAAKVAAATRARRDLVVIARTDAVAVEGLERALDRAERYVEAGADILFVEAPRTDDELKAVTERFRGRIPLLANMVEGGRTPIHPAAELEAMGFSIVIFAAGLARAFAHMAQDYLASLKRDGSTRPYSNRMLDFDGLNGVIGTDALLELGRKYDADAQGGNGKAKR